MDRRIDRARELMDRLVERTQVTGGSRSRRYLWTDAFAVRNLLAIASAAEEGSYTEPPLAVGG